MEMYDGILVWVNTVLRLGDPWALMSTLIIRLGWVGNLTMLGSLRAGVSRAGIPPAGVLLGLYYPGRGFPLALVYFRVKWDTHSL